MFRKEKNDQQKSCSVEASLHLPSVIPFASEHNMTTEMVLDKLIDDLDRQLLKYKEELEERR